MYFVDMRIADSKMPLAGVPRRTRIAVTVECIPWGKHCYTIMQVEIVDLKVPRSARGCSLESCEGQKIEHVENILPRYVVRIGDLHTLYYKCRCAIHAAVRRFTLRYVRRFENIRVQCAAESIAHDRSIINELRVSNSECERLDIIRANKATHPRCSGLPG